jgi:hypothetical protein
LTFACLLDLETKLTVQFGRVFCRLLDLLIMFYESLQAFDFYVFARFRDLHDGTVWMRFSRLLDQFFVV